MTRVNVTISDRGREILSDTRQRHADIDARLLRLGCQVACDEELMPPERLQAIATELGCMFVDVSTAEATEWILQALEAYSLKPHAR